MEQEVMEATTRGTLIHQVFEQIDLMKHTTYEEIYDEINRLIAKGKLPEEVRQIVSIKKLENVAKSKLFARMKQANYVWKEKAFVYLLPAAQVDSQYPEDENILIQGVVDTCFIEDDHVVLIDYKTDYVDKENREKSIEEIKERYRIQLELYGLALGHIMKKDVKEKWIYLYSIDTWIAL